jgi:RNA 2',3'-cyclic 3'-phosphodiesterase
MMFDVRLFTGLSLPPEALKNFEVLLDELEPLARIRWSPVSQLHITTKFIGAFPFHRIGELCRFLHGLPKTPKFSITLTGLRYLKLEKGGWLLYAKLEPNEELNQLAATMDEALGFYNIPREWRPYHPHVTIGRVPGNNPWLELDERVEANTERPLCTFEVGEYHLYESTASGYRNVSSITLA